MFNLNAHSPSTRSPAVPSKYTDVDIGDYYDESVGEADFLPSVPSSPLCSLFPGGMDTYPEPLSAPLPAYDVGRPKSIGNKRGSVNYADNMLLTSPSVWSRPLASPKFKGGLQPQRNSYANTASKLMATMAEEEEDAAAMTMGRGEEEQRRYLEKFKFPAQPKPRPPSTTNPLSANRLPVRTDVVAVNNPKKKYDKNNKPQLSLTLPKSQNEKRLNGNLNKGVEECHLPTMSDRCATCGDKSSAVRWKWVMAILFLLATALFAAGFTKWIITNSSANNAVPTTAGPSSSPKHVMAMEKVNSP